MHRVGRYELVRVVGQGGMGRVHEAVVRGAGGRSRRVALKLLHEGGERLIREARIGGLLRHPNLVAVHELGEAQGQWYCAMQLVEGGSLAGRGPLPPRAVVEVGLQVCAALAYAQSAVGLVHLDLKPENLLVDGATVKVADLGVARARGFAHDGRVRGTQGYMSPEQRRGEPTDARSDLYSLGVVLLELATGRSPRDGAPSTLDTLWTLTGSEAVDDEEARTTPPEVGWLEPILERCLAPERDLRFPSATAMAAALRALEVPGPGLAEHLGLPPAGGEPIALETNLGAELDAFVGRDAELAELAQALARPGIVVLKGLGGMGKTRLARRAAAAYRERAGREVWFCDLTEATSAEGLLRVLASVLGLALDERSPEAQIDQIGAALAGRPEVLLVLDNFERLVPVAGLVARLHGAAPSARLLLTTRDAPHLEGEVVVALVGLSTADGIALVVERARSRGWEVAEEPDLELLVQRLDALPLALELVAPHVGALGAQGVLAALDEPLKLLRGAGGERNDTLRGALDWSWEALSADERDALARLSVFRGGVTLDAAEAVLDPLGGGLSAVQRLADRSLVSVREGRVHLYESVRAYASERLEAREAVEALHGRWFAALDPGETSVRAVGARARLTVELDNLVIACQRAIARGDGAVAAATCRGAWAIYDVRGPARAGADLTEQVLAMPSLSERDRGVAHEVGARAWNNVGDKARALRHALAAVAVWRDLGERTLEVEARAALSVALAAFDRNHEAIEAFHQAIAGYRALGDEAGEGRTTGNLGIVQARVGLHAEAKQSLERALALHQRTGNRQFEAIVCNSLGVAEHRGGRLASARARYLAALEIEREVGNQRREVTVRVNYSTLLRDCGDLAGARAELARARALAEGMGVPFNDALILENEAYYLLDEGDPRGARVLFERALALRQHNPGARALCRAQLAQVFIELGELDEAATCLEAAWSAAREAGDESTPQLLCFEEARLAVCQGRREDARTWLDQALVRARAQSRPIFVARAQLELARLEAGAGPVSLQALDEVVGVLEEAGWFELLALQRALRGHALACAGQREVGRRVLQDALAAAHHAGMAWLAAQIRILCADLAAREGRTADAARELGEVERQLAEAGVGMAAPLSREVASVRDQLGRFSPIPRSTPSA